MAELRAEFVRLLIEHQPQIYACIRGMAPNRAEAEALLQETSALLWEKFDQFRTGTSFLHWSLSNARFVVLSYYRDRGRDRLRFDEGFLETLADRTVVECGHLGEVRAALEHCLQSLSGADRELLMRRYASGAVIADIAEQVGRPVQSVYSRLKRLRCALFQCIERTRQAWDR